jgi:flagellar biosynthesis/type III secretory pathway chaperone
VTLDEKRPAAVPLAALPQSLVTGLPAMAVIVAELTSALEEERVALTSMLDVATREELAIVGGNVALLTELATEKEHLIELVAALESERSTAITVIAIATGHDPTTATLSSVVASLSEADALALASVAVELRREANALRAANERNAQLLQTSRDIVDRWLQHLRARVTGVLSEAGERAVEVSRRARRERAG